MRKPVLLCTYILLPLSMTASCSSDTEAPPAVMTNMGANGMTATTVTNTTSSTTSTVTTGTVSGTTGSATVTSTTVTSTTGTVGSVSGGGTSSTTVSSSVTTGQPLTSTSTDGSTTGNGGATSTTDSGTTDTVTDTSTTGMAVDPNTYAAEFDGYTLFTNCDGNTTQVCRPSPGPCDNGTCPANCPNDNDPALRGTTQHQTFTFGADAPAGTMYNMAFRAQGVVEAKRYSGGTDQDSGSQIPADGFYTGGIPDNSDGYNVYLIRVECPTMGCSQDYFLNSIGIPGDTRIRHAVFAVDFEGTIPIEAGSTVHFVSADNNCSAIDNCGENPPGGTDCPNPTTFNGLDAKIAAHVGNQPYDGQFVGIVVQSVTPQ